MYEPPLGIQESLQKAGFPHAVPDKVVNVINNSPSSKPSAAPTTYLTVVEIIQRVDSVSENQVKTKEFVAAFQLGMYSSSSTLNSLPLFNLSLLLQTNKLKSVNSNFYLLVSTLT